MTSPRRTPTRLSHLDSRGRVAMVDVSDKPVTARRAVAESKILVSSATARLVEKEKMPKGNVEAAVRIAAIQAAKKAHELIPLCHPLAIDAISVSVARRANGFTITVEVASEGKTGVEMEAMCGAAVGALAFYDMIKGVERGAEIRGVRLMKKEGGKSGVYSRISRIARSRSIR